MKKIAIACQGGGSQTAFTAGVLQELFENKIDEKFEIVGISGTSGGALNAALAWYGLLQKKENPDTSIENVIYNFWQELKADSPFELFLDSVNAEIMRASGRGYLPHLANSPSGYFSQLITQVVEAFSPRKNFLDFRNLIEEHIDFEHAQRILDETSPALFMGAANVLTGQVKIFNSKEEKIIPESILASAAIPSVFPAVQIGDSYYWDGLFSSNPPISSFIRPSFIGRYNMPEEIWVILIDPFNYTEVPTDPYDILERRTQMTSNISLIHDLEKVAILSRLVRDGHMSDEIIETFGITKNLDLKFKFIKISEEQQGNLDYASKLSRNPQLIDSLMSDGRKQTKEFLKNIDKPGKTPEEAILRIFDRKAPD